MFCDTIPRWVDVSFSVGQIADTLFASGFLHVFL